MGLHVLTLKKRNIGLLILSCAAALYSTSVSNSLFQLKPEPALLTTTEQLCEINSYVSQMCDMVTCAVTKSQA